MNTKNFGNGYVGIKINSISEIMKYNALKEQFSIWNEYEGTFDDDVEVTDDDGNVTEREPTENEKIERYLEAFNNGTILCSFPAGLWTSLFRFSYYISEQVCYRTAGLHYEGQQNCFG